MLETHDRTLLLESLAPPRGQRLDFAIGTTYTLDLLALLTAPVALAFDDCADADGKPPVEPLLLLKAIRENAGKIALFHHAGRIHVQKKFNAALALELENAVFGVLPASGGRFHPKLWVLRFSNESVVTYRVLCMSRNLTFDRSWDTVLVLEGLLTDRTLGFSRNRPLADFVATLPGLADRPLSKEWRKHVKVAAEELRIVDFTVPEPFTDFAFHPLGLEKSKHPIPEDLQRLLVISPFVDDTALKDLQRRARTVSLVSRQECLDELKVETRDGLEKIWTLGDEGTETDDDSEPLTGLHAKLYIAEQGWNASVFTGSANATNAGFHRNVEFLVELIGKKSKVGIDAILGEDKKNLSALLWEYHPDATAGDDAVKKFENECDQLADAIAAMRPEAVCEPLPEDQWQVRLQATRRKVVKILDDCTLHAASLAAPGASPVDLGGAPFAEFTLSLAGVSSFFVFDFARTGTSLLRSFVLNVPLINPPEGRRERALQHLLGDPARVLKFLLMLLLGESAPAAMAALNEPDKPDTPADKVVRIGDATLFESLLHAAAREPHRIKHLLDTVDDLRKAGPQWLPPDLEVLLQPFRDFHLAKERS